MQGTSNQQIFAQLYDEFMPKVFAFIHYKVNDGPTTEDLTSLVFEKALANFTRYSSDKAAFNTWVFTIARNTVIDYYRTESKKKHLDIEAAVDVPAAGFTPEQALEKQTEKECLMKCMSRLGEPDREIVQLKFGAEMAIPDEVVRLQCHSSGDGDRFQVGLANGEHVRARAVVIASGANHVDERKVAAHVGEPVGRPFGRAQAIVDPLEELGLEARSLLDDAEHRLAWVHEVDSELFRGEPRDLLGQSQPFGFAGIEQPQQARARGTLVERGRRERGLQGLRARGAPERHALGDMLDARGGGVITGLLQHTPPMKGRTSRPQG